MLFNRSCNPVKVGGYAEHVHILVSIPSHLSIFQIVREIQQNSLDFLRRENSVFPEFTGWDSNYFALSYHFSQVDELTKEISKQFDYHRSISFIEEIDALLSTKTV
jgi:REP element-mobilizing transposase RayT